MNPGHALSAAQREVRTVFLNGAVGQAVAGAIWLGSALAGTWVGVRPAILILVVGGAFIFPGTRLILWLAGRRSNLDRSNPLAGLAMQVAFIVPVLLPLAGAAALHRLDWFYPAVMLIVGAHYMPFVFLYGMPSFAVLAAALMAGGVTLGLTAAGGFTAGAWLTAMALFSFSLHAATNLGDPVSADPIA